MGWTLDPGDNISGGQPHSVHQSIITHKADLDGGPDMHCEGETGLTEAEGACPEPKESMHSLGVSS